MRQFLTYEMLIIIEKMNRKLRNQNDIHDLFLLKQCKHCIIHEINCLHYYKDEINFHFSFLFFLILFFN